MLIDTAELAVPPTALAALATFVRHLPAARRMVIDATRPLWKNAAMFKATSVLHGYHFVCSPSDDNSVWLYLGLVEPEISTVMMRLLPPGGVFVDVGACFGHFSLLAAAGSNGRARVIAF